MQNIEKTLGEKLAFPSENHLRQAVAGLLLRMDGVKDVQITHGTQEYGKDIVFTSRGPLGEAELNAVVIKNSKITGSVGKSGSVREVFFQIQQAADTPLIDGRGEERLVNRVYVLSPYDIPQTALRAIASKLRAESLKVEFIGGPKLLELFREHWPDFLLDEFVAIEEYLQEIKSTASENREIKRLAEICNFGPVGDPRKLIYVERSLVRSLDKFKIIEAEKSRPDVVLEGASRFSKSYIVDLIGRFKTLRRKLEYFDKWEAVPREPAVEDADALGGWLRELWLSRYRKQENRPSVTFRKASKKKSVSFSDGDLREISLRYSALTSSVEERFADIQSVALSANDFLDSQVDNVELDELGSEEWLGLFKNNDFLAHAPVRLLELSHYRLLKFSERSFRTSRVDLLVAGPAGLGKTSFCRWNALRDSQLFSEGESNILPVYVPLNSLVDKELLNFEDAFLPTVGRSAFLGRSNVEAAEKLRLYLDGLDEIPDEKKRQEVIRLARTKGGRPEKVQLIVTSRDYIVGEWLSWLPRVFLGKLDDREISVFLEKWFGDDAAGLSLLEGQLKENPAIHELMRTPLLATIVVLMFKRRRHLSHTRAALYGDFIDLLCGGWDLAKGVLRASRFGIEIKKQLLEEIAFDAHKSGLRFFKEDVVLRAARRIFVEPISFDVRVLREELISDGILTRSVDSYYFSHLSFQEFLVASHIFRAGRGSVKKAQLSAWLQMNEQWWSEAHSYYVELTNDRAG